MKYFIFIISLLLLSSVNYPSQIQRISEYNDGSKFHLAYLSIGSYQEDYSELQKKSVNINIKVKNILETIKPY